MERIKFNLIESLSYKANITWTHNPHNQIGYFSIGKEKYTITIQFSELPISNKQYEVYEISFQRLIGGNPTVEQTPSQHGSKVFGAVYNETLNILNQDKPEIVIYSAKYANDNNDQETFNKRIGIYNGIAHRLAQHGTYKQISHEPLKSAYALNFILVRSDIKISSDELNYIKQNI